MAQDPFAVLTEAKLNKLSTRGRFKQQLLEQQTGDNSLVLDQFNNEEEYYNAGGIPTIDTAGFFRRKQLEASLRGVAARDEERRLNRPVEGSAGNRRLDQVATDPLRKFTGALLGLGGGIADLASPDPVPGDTVLERAGERASRVASGLGTAALAVGDALDIGGVNRENLRATLDQSNAERVQAIIAEDAKRAIQGRPSLEEERNASTLNRVGDELGKVGRFIGTEGVSPQQQEADRQLGEAANEGFLAVLGYGLQNPVDFASTVGPDTAAFLVPAAVAGRISGVVGKATGLSGAEAANLAANVGITTAGATASIQNASSVAAQIFEMTPEQLAISPVYQELIDQGLDESQARVEMADRAFATTLAASGFTNTVTLGIAARFRANVLEDLVAGRTPNLGANAFTGTLSAAFREGAAETPQEAGDALSAELGEVAAGTRSPEDLGETVPGAAAIGLLAGAGTGAPAGAVIGGARALEEQKEQRTQKVTEAAVNSGNVLDLVIPGPDQDIGKALTILQKYVEEKPATETVVKSSDLIVTALEKQVEGLQTALKVTTPEERTAIETKLAELEQSNPDIFGLLTGQLQELDTATAQLVEAQAFQASVTEQFSELQAQQEAAVAEREAEVALANTAPTPESRVAAQSVVTLAMRVPDDVPTETLETLSSSTDNAFTPDERTLLKNIADNRKAIEEFNKSIDDVQRDLLEGGPGFKGLKQYQEAFQAAVGANNLRAATQEVAQLRRLAATRRSKATAVSEAFEQVLGTSNELFVAANDNGQWARVDSITQQQRDNGTGLKINPRSTRLVSAIEKEAAILTTGEQALRSTLQVLNNPQPAPVATPTPTPVDAVQQTGPEIITWDTLVPGQIVKLYRGENQENNSDINGQWWTTNRKKAEKFGKGGRVREAQLPSEVIGRHAARGATADEFVFPDKKPNELASTDVIEAVVEVPPSTSTPQATEAVPDEAQPESGRLVEEEVTPTSAEPTPVEETSQEALEEPVEPAVTQLEPDVQAEVDATTDPEVLTGVPPASAFTQVDEAPPKETESGVLSQIQGAPIPVFDWTAKDYFELNHLTQFFTQSEGREDSGTKRPLVAIKNFISEVLDGNATFADFLSKDIDDFQQHTLDEFVALSQRFGRRINDLIPPVGKRNRKFFYEDPINYFMDENGAIEENVKTAISFGVFTWLSENAGRTVNDNRAINGILGRNADHIVIPDERRWLAGAGETANLVYARLGQRIFQTLGFKALEHAPEDGQAKLESLLGLMAVQVLKAEGIVEIHRIPLNVLNELKNLPPPPPADRRATQNFVRFKRREGSKEEDIEIDVNALRKAARVKGAMAESQSVLAKAFGAEDSARLPSFEPQPYNQKRIKGIQDVPEQASERLAAKNQQPWQMRRDSLAVFDGLEEVVDRIAGVKPDNYRSHKENILSQRAKDEDFERQIDNFNAFRRVVTSQEQQEDTPFFFSHDMWVSARVGLVENLINPQTSKVHRFLVSMTKWKQTVDLDNADQMHHFRIAVAQGLDIDIDKKDHAKALVELEAFTKNKRIAEAIRLLRTRIYDDATLSPIQQQRVAEAVELGKGAFHSLDALIALAHMEQAEQTQFNDSAVTSLITADTPTKPRTFTVYMMAEVDGVTNGPMLSQLSLGTADWATLARGGFFQEQEEARQDGGNYNVWRGTPGNLDLYEKSAETLANVLIRLARSQPRLVPVINAIYTITGELAAPASDVTNADGELATPVTRITSAGRKMVKAAITPLVFASTVRNAVADMAEEFVQGYYDKIESLANSGATEGSLVTVIESINLILRQGGVANRFWLDPNMSIDAALDQRLNDTQKRAIKEVFTNTVGLAIGSALETNFSLFIERRKSLIKSADVSYRLYNGFIEAREAATLNKLAEAGRLAMTEERRRGKQVIPAEPAHGLPLNIKEEIANELDDMIPYVNTPYSAAEGNPKAGILMPKTEGNLGDAAANSINPAVRNDRKQSGVDQTKLHTLVRNLIHPGVRIIPLVTHSIDSWISHFAGEGLPVINLHDALGINPSELVKVAKLLNEMTFNVLLNFSSPMEAFNMMGRSLIAAQSNAGVSNSDAQTLADIGREILAATAREVEISNFGRSAEEQIDPPTSIIEIVEDVWRQARAADSAKLNALSQMGFVSQYAYEGGSYVVTPADRKAAKDKLDALPREMPADIRTAAERIDAYMTEGLESSTEQEHRPDPSSDAEIRNQEENPPQKGTATVEELTALDQVIVRYTKEDSLLLPVAQTISNRILKDNISLAEAVRRLDKEGLQRPVTLSVVLNDVIRVKNAAPPGIATSVELGALERVISNWDSDDLKVLLPLALAVKNLMLKDNINAAQAVRILKNNKDETRDNKVYYEEIFGWIVEQVNAAPTEHPLGELGRSTIDSDTGLITIFEKHGPSINALSIIKTLRTRLDTALAGESPDRITKFRRELLNQLAKVVDPQLKFEYITPETDPETVFGENVSKARGWYVSGGEKGKRVFIRSPAFKYSGVTDEVLIHELTHAALKQIIDDVRAKPSHAAAPLVAELETLREAVVDFLEEPENAALKNQFVEASLDVQELVAWGMSNDGFQRNVLEKIQLETKTATAKNKFVSAFKEFADTLARMIFGDLRVKRNDRLSSGMTFLISNVSGLFAAEADVQGQGTRDANIEFTLRQDVPDPTTLNNQQVFDALAQHQTEVLDPTFATYLKGLLTRITEKAHGPFGAIHAQYAADPALTRADVFAQSLATGTSPFVSKVLGSSIPVTTQEAFVLEQVEASISALLNNSGVNPVVTEVNKQLLKVYREARTVLKPSHFEQVFGVTPAEAQQQWDFIFTAEQNPDGRSDVLSRFAALGLTSEKFGTLLDFDTYKSSGRWRNLNWRERLDVILDKVLDFFSGRLLVAGKNQDAAKKQLEALVDQLVRIENRNQARLKRKQLPAIQTIEAGVKRLSEGTREKVEKFAGASIFSESRSAVVQALSATATTIAGRRVDKTLEVIQVARNNALKRKQGVIAGLVTDLRSMTGWVNDAIREATNNEQMRKGIKEGLSEVTLKEYGRDLTPGENKGLAYLLRTDPGVLLDSYDLTQFEELLRSPATLEREIKAWEARLKKDHPKYYDRYIRQAKDLGFDMAVGLKRNPHLHLNAYNISRLADMNVGVVTEANARAAEKILDPLISLYTLKWTDSVHKQNVSEVMRFEANRTDKLNGIAYTLNLQKQLAKESKELLFKGSESQVIKGYTPELYQDGIQIKVATEQEGEEYEKMGYVNIGQLTNDKADADQRVRFLFRLPDHGLQAYNTGAISNREMAARGRHSKQRGGGSNLTDSLDITGQKAVQRHVTREKQRLINAMDLSPSYDPSKQPNQNHMVPDFNPQGKVVGYRYMMSQQFKDQVMLRENNFNVMLGTLKANTFDKISSQEQNAHVLQALHDQYLADVDTIQKDSYLEISATSDDPDLREYWDLLPESAKIRNKAITGRNAIRVRTDHLFMIFGYRKFDLGSQFAKKDPVLSVQGQATAATFDILDGLHLRGHKQERVARNVQGFVEEMVRQTKDILVVKTGTTLAFNIMSNVTQLYLSGVPIKDIVTNGRIALKGAMDYRADQKQLLKFQTMRDSGYLGAPGTVQEIEQEIILLENQIARNPARELIEAGLLPTIVEDVSLDDDTYDYKNKIANTTEKAVNRLPTPIQKTARFLYMTHDTPLYKVLSHGTQYSDFVARYALYHHMTERKSNPLSKEEALRDASDMFINYDVPAHPTIQALNDLGFLYFTKYYIRIQRTIFKLFQENPARALMLLTADHYFEGMQTLVDSIAYPGNPFEVSVLKAAEAADEGLVINTVLNVWGD